MAQFAALMLTLAATALGASVLERQSRTECGAYSLAENQRVFIKYIRLFRDDISEGSDVESRMQGPVPLPPSSEPLPGTVRCEWDVRCPSEETHYLEISCPWFFLWPSENCENDRLVISQEGKEDIKCGLLFPHRLTTPTGWARIAYMSTGKAIKSSFVCSVVCRAKPNESGTTPAPDVSSSSEMAPAPEELSTSTPQSSSTSGVNGRSCNS